MVVVLLFGRYCETTLYLFQVMIATLRISRKHSLLLWLAMLVGCRSDEIVLLDSFLILPLLDKA